MRKISILLISGALIIASCAREIETPLSITATNPPQSNTTAAISQKEIPTSYSYMGTVTVIPGSAPTEMIPSTPTPEPDVSQVCITTQSHLPEIHPYHGEIAFETKGAEMPINFLLYNLQTGKMTNIPGKANDDLFVSPDGTMFVFVNRDTRRLELFSADGKQIKSRVWQKNWGAITGWFDNQQIGLVMAEEESHGSRNTIYPPTILVINLFTDQIQYLQPDYPDIDKAHSFFGWDLSGATVYDPSLTRVVYPGTMENKVEPEATGYILFGIPEKMKLVEIPNPVWTYHPPVWSPDGSKFLMKGMDEFYLVSKDGTISKITHMNPSFDPVTRKGSLFESFYYTWSPDGQNVAFWLADRGNDHRTLAILDTSTGKITDTCIPSGYSPDNVRTLPYPVWSRDGKSLVVSSNYRQEENGFDAVLIDLEKHASYKIASGLFPIGWLPPK